MNVMQVCITGANGFVGRRLVEALSQRGYSIRVLTRRPDGRFSSDVEVVIGDLTSPNCTLDRFLLGCELLFHCAGEIRDAKAMHALHVGGTQRLLKAVAEQSVRSGHKIHWVQLSSVGVYGPPPGSASTERIVTEVTPPRPVGEYEMTKAKADELVMEASGAGAMTCSIVRPSNIIGSGMANQSVFNLIAMVDRGLFFYIGKPGASANYIHVDNVVESLVNCGSKHAATGAVFNVSDHCTLEHFVEVIAGELGRRSPWLRIPESIASLAGITLGRLPGFPLTQSRVNALVNRTAYPISRIQDELGYHHVVSMEDGLRDLVKAYTQRFRHRE